MPETFEGGLESASTIEKGNSFHFCNEWRALLAMHGPEESLQRLADRLESVGEFRKWFDAMALRARFELGLPLILPASGHEFPDDKRAAYEERLIAACREAGKKMTDAGDYQGAFHFLGTIGELQPLWQAIESFEPTADDGPDAENQVDLIIELAIGHGVHPRKGLELMLRRSGLCPAITACQSIFMQDSRDDVKVDCARLMVRELHCELLDRVRAHIRQVEGESPLPEGLTSLIEGRDWLFAEDNHHVDTSHLNAVVRFARSLPNCGEARLAMELCEYGKRLSPRYHFGDAAPFERVFDDTLKLLQAVTRTDVDGALQHFREKAIAASRVGETSPLEVYVNLLIAADLSLEAAEFAGIHLNRLNGGIGLSCPSVTELWRRQGRFDRIAELAKERGDLVSFAAGVIAALQDSHSSSGAADDAAHTGPCGS